MSRYISIESVAKAFSFHTVRPYVEWLEMIRDSILRGDIELANVREVKRGKWIYDKYGHPKCSNCNSIALQGMDLQHECSNFCPNCGADMRGEEE